VLAVADFPQYGYATTWAVLTAGEITDADREHKKELIKEGRALVPEGVEDHGRLLVGRAGHKLAEASEDFDLLVTGSRSYGPVMTTLLGSTTRKLVHNAACPVLVLPRGSGPDPLGLDMPAEAERATS
jgi:nucleotide-binding universal stress UspA family protein